MKGDLSLPHIMGILIVVILILIIALVASGSATLIPQEKFDKVKICGEWIGQGCPSDSGMITSGFPELAEWCVSRNKCIKECEIFVPVMGDNCKSYGN